MIMIYLYLSMYFNLKCTIKAQSGWMNIKKQNPTIGCVQETQIGTGKDNLCKW